MTVMDLRETPDPVPYERVISSDPEAHVACDCGHPDCAVKLCEPCPPDCHEQGCHDIGGES